MLSDFTVCLVMTSNLFGEGELINLFIAAGLVETPDDFSRFLHISTTLVRFGVSCRTGDETCSSGGKSSSSFSTARFIAFIRS